MENIAVKPDLEFPRHVNIATKVSLAPDSISIEARVDFSTLKWRYVMTDVRYRRDVDHGGLAAHELRAVDVWRVIEQELQKSVILEGKPLFMSLPQSGAHLRGADDSVFLLGAARKYAVARAVGLSPLKELASWLDVSRTTAIRTAARARAAGLLDEAGGDDGSPA